MSIRLSTAGGLRYTAQAIGGSRNLTVAWTLTPNSTLSAGTRIVQQWGATASTQQGFFTGVINTTEIQFVLYYGGGWYGYRTSTAPLAANRNIRVVCRAWDLNGATKGMDIWVNGAQQALVDISTTGTNVTQVNSSNQPISIGWEPAESADGLFGDYAQVAVWTSKIPDDLAAGWGIIPNYHQAGLVFYAPLTYYTNDEVTGAGGVPNGALTFVPTSVPQLPRTSVAPLQSIRRFLGTESASTLPPAVSAGPDQYVVAEHYLTNPISTTLEGVCAVDCVWTKVWGPGTVTFTNSTSPTTSVEFSVAGSYRLRLTADDGVTTNYSDVVINITTFGTNIAQVVIEVLRLTKSPTAGTTSFSAIEAPLLPAHGRVSFAELDIPLVVTQGGIGFAEFSITSTPTAGFIGFAEFQLSTNISAARIGFAEFSVPFVLAAGRTSYSDLEVPDFASADVAIAQVVVEAAITPVTPINIAQVVVEYADLPVSRNEFAQIVVEVLVAPPERTAGYLGWSEFTIPITPQQGRLSYSSMSLPAPPYIVLEPLQRLVTVYAGIEWQDLYRSRE